MQHQFISQYSSNINYALYCERNKMLDIHFLKGSCYRYLNVPPEIFTALKSAPSAGLYFHNHIKANFPEIRLSASR